MFRKFFILMGLLLGLISGQGFAVVTIQNTKAVLQRGDYSKITLTFTVLNIGPTESTAFGLSKYSPSEGAQMLTRYLDICVSDQTGQLCAAGSIPKKVPYTNSTGDATPVDQQRPDITAGFLNGGPSFEVDSSNTSPTTIYHIMEVAIELSGTPNLFTTSTVVSFRLVNGTTTTNNDWQDKEAKASLAVAANGVVTSLKIVPSKGTLTATWEKDEAIGRTKGEPAVSDGALAFVVPEEAWGTQNIAIHNYIEDNPAAETVQNDACYIDKGDNEENCELICKDLSGTIFEDEDDKHYLKASDLGAQDVVTANNVGSLAIDNLSAKSRYAFVFQNQPDGLKRRCIIAQPSDAVLLSELGGGPEAEPKDPRCFIATAAYGSALDPHLNTLRWFRDHVLLVTRVGDQLVQTYYRYSPPLAAFIGAHPTLRTFTRGLLWLPVILIETWRERPSLFLTLGAMSATFLLLFLRRRSLRASV